MRYIVAAAILLVLLPQQGGWPVCSQAVHDAARHRATGPDGASYATWHPQYDGYAQCYFTHEHGSDPALVMPGYKPLYGYSARTMPEAHNGFKGYAFRAAGHAWYLTQHQGTGNAALAACARHHTLDMLVLDDQGIAADLHLMADFGRAVANETGAVLTTVCPQVQGNGTGVRQFPIASMKNIGYEPWRADLPGNVLGVRLQNITFNTLNPITACDTLTCTAALPRTDPGIGPALGAHRALTLHAGFGIVASGAYSGTFTTDMHGAGAGDTQQYIRPGLDVRLAQSAGLSPYGASHWYALSVPGYDAYPFRRSPFVSGGN